jgi:hypothetical protein
MAKLAVFSVLQTGVRIIAILGKCGSNNTPQHPNTPFEKQAGGQLRDRPKDTYLIFLAPRHSTRHNTTSVSATKPCFFAPAPERIRISG